MQVIFRTAQALHLYRNIEAHEPNSIAYSECVSVFLPWLPTGKPHLFWAVLYFQTWPYKGHDFTLTKCLALSVRLDFI
jgi:hypothetical protein